jgi:hypothetical protein
MPLKYIKRNIKKSDFNAVNTKNKNKINKVKEKFTRRSSRHTQAGQPEGTKPKQRMDTMASKGEGNVKC